LLYKTLLENGLSTFKRTTRLTENEWLKLRQSGIGGSDCGAIMGMNKYATPLSCYLSKTVAISDENKTTNESIQWGKMAESAIRDGLAKDLKLLIEEVPGMFTSVKYPFMNANLDGLVDAKEGTEINGVFVSGLGGLEIKTATDRNTEFTNDEIPDSYYCQVQHYMSVTGLNWFMLAVLIGKVSGKIYVVPRNDNFIERIIEKESFFWNENVLKNEMPAPTGNERESEAINALMNSAPSEIELPEEFESFCNEYKTLDAQIKELKQNQELIKERIKLAICNTEGEGENNSKIIAKAGSYKITWQKQLRKVVDTEALKKNGLFEEYSKNSESLVMRINAGKEKE